MGDQSTNIFVIYANILFWLVKTILPFYLMGKEHMSNHSEESSGSYMTMHMTFKYIFALLMNQNGLTDSCQM